MTSEWKECCLGDIISLVIDHRGLTPKKLGGDWSKKGYRALSAKNIKTGKIVHPESIRFVNEDMYHKWMPEEIKFGDILVTSEAPFGEIYQWNSGEKIVLSQRLFGIRVSSFYDADYIYYYMISNIFKSEMYARATGTTVIGLRQPELLKCKIRYPDINIQRKIASILKTIDRKIEINEEINKNLEDQAQAYFINLFIVNADPNWQNGTISDIGTVVGGGTPSKKHPEYYSQRGIPWITPKDLSIDRSKFISRGNNDISELGFSNSSATKIPKGTVLFSSRAPIGYIAIASTTVTTNQGFKSVIPNNNIGTAFIYFFLKQALPTIEGMASGSTFKEISGSGMKSVPVVIPDDETLHKFSEFCKALFEQQIILEAENRRLSSLRDTLLPKLMSGEIDVSNIDF